MNLSFEMIADLQNEQDIINNLGKIAGLSPPYCLHPSTKIDISDKNRRVFFSCETLMEIPGKNFPLNVLGFSNHILAWMTGWMY